MTAPTTPIDPRYPNSPHAVRITEGLHVTIAEHDHGATLIAIVIVLITWYADNLDGPRWFMSNDIAEADVGRLTIDTSPIDPVSDTEPWEPSDHDMLRAALVAQGRASFGGAA